MMYFFFAFIGACAGAMLGFYIGARLMLETAGAKLVAIGRLALDMKRDAEADDDPCGIGWANAILGIVRGPQDRDDPPDLFMGGPLL